MCGRCLPRPKNLALVSMAVREILSTDCIVMGPSCAEYIRARRIMRERCVVPLGRMRVTTRLSSAMTISTVLNSDSLRTNVGGLGGEFVISTSSITSGNMVIRHELGHNLIPVGEEYDGGWVYRGVNSAHSLHDPWPNWLTNDSHMSIE